MQYHSQLIPAQLSSTSFPPPAHSNAVFLRPLQTACSANSSGVVNLRDGVIGTPAGLPYVRELVKLHVRALITPAISKQWVTYWNSTSFHVSLAKSAPCLLKKIYRPYLSNRLVCDDRFSILKAHYQFIGQCSLGALVLSAAHKPVMLAQFEGKSGAMYQIQLVALTEMEREGELVLQLVNDDVVLCTVAFTFLAHTDVLSIAIGCLQGGRAAETKENIRFATRDLFGLRPKTMLVRLVQQLGLQLGCRDVQLVSNANRVVQRQLRKKLVFADYDITWQELGAIQYAHGDYVLPCVELAPPDLTAIASSKRSEAKKRFALLSEIVTSVTEAIDVEQRSDAVITETWLDVPSRGAWRRKLYPHVRQCVGFVFQNAAMIAGIQCYLILSPLA